MNNNNIHSSALCYVIRAFQMMAQLAIVGNFKGENKFKKYTHRIMSNIIVINNYEIQ